MENWQIWQIKLYSPQYSENAFVYALTSLFAKFFLTNSFYLYRPPNFYGNDPLNILNV